MSVWDLNEGTLIKQRSMKRCMKNDVIHYVKANALKDLTGIPNRGEQFRIITEKQFNAYSLILLLLENNIIKEMYLAIYRINQPTVNSIIRLIEEGRIKKSYFVISNYFNQTKKPEVWAKKLRDFAVGNKSCNHIYTHNHSKVLAVKTDNNNHYVFEGSGNMSDNARIEQYLFEENEESFKFHSGWIKDLTNNGTY